MPDIEHGQPHKRTAVLVVHGIGSQRALETVRGVIRGVWLDRENPADSGKKIWNHPEPSVADIDLAVMTTNAVPGSSDGRSVDFHELYWAHLMSETKAVAVLLWLYELGRKGPLMKLGMNGLWWVAAIFLCLMNLSIALLVLQGVLVFSQPSPQAMLVAPFLLMFCSVAFGLAVAFRYRDQARRLIEALAKLCAVGVAVIIAYILLEWLGPGGSDADAADLVTMIALPTLNALLASWLLMGKQGLRAFWRALAISAAAFLLSLLLSVVWHPEAGIVENLVSGWRPWSLNSPSSLVLAWVVIGFYLVINAAFLQPYLGDAARYFRGSPANVAVRRAIRKEAVDMLDHLHTSGRYDRIIIVAHSLGCVVAYDMLRAYFSRVCDQLPPAAELGQDFIDIDQAAWRPDKPASVEDKKALRVKARRVIAGIADATVNKPVTEGIQPAKSWLVTDFVTLGNALTHAYFLMCLGNTRADLETDFLRRVEEREFPTCPPTKLDSDGLLAFDNHGKKQVHHGALFGLTRWSNIYFPLDQIFWGDAIGGAVAPIFGSHIVDVPVETRTGGGADFFTHTAYWDVERLPEKGNAPHIVALRKAVDLADLGTGAELIK